MACHCIAVAWYVLTRLARLLSCSLVGQCETAWLKWGLAVWESDCSKEGGRLCQDAAEDFSTGIVTCRIRDKHWPRPIHG
jgi:hypothetical protein